MGTIAIIGAGASGMAAAIKAAQENKNAKIILLDQKDCLGKKILVTGNGKCNLTNHNMSPEWYRSENISFVEQVLSAYGTDDILDFFQSIGLITKSKGNYVYPRTEQAVTVRDILEKKIRNNHIKIQLNAQVFSTSKVLDKNGDSRFKIEFLDLTTNKKLFFFCDKLILACGGTAAKVHGSDGSGYGFAKSFAHHTIPIVPALVQLKVKANPFSFAAGVRTFAKVSAIVDKKKEAEDAGELQITSYGISGIPVFQISRHISRALRDHKKSQVIVDFLPEYSESEMIEMLEDSKTKRPYLDLCDFLSSILPLKLAECILNTVHIEGHSSIDSLSNKQKEILCNALKMYPLTISDTKGFDQAQVCAGGVNTEEINVKTMESRIVKGLYIVGELMDVDGLCGGYNLHWAFATGLIAGKAAAQDL